ncbi:hypothetical protein NEA10_08910 [Phormidium yuhuli AB48]|uniref:Uncharacterized protein n=1 Tax=Phormidium yuhuli AB48 TaxID=2940671 RepID=A0ABY5AX54_9CYAN|nr:hypothetical protein [Phormidium yuhuli]USR92814.1 hypothetical protein NEA10_08910 [Phormidium yuhuli AB48]
MERGLLWLPLLVLFFGLAWAGWNEFRKVEAYQRWAKGFDRAKYDILAVLGQRGDRLVWGKSSRTGVVEMQEFSLTEVTAIEVEVNGNPINEAHPPKSSRTVSLCFQRGEAGPIQVPFTEISLALKWAQALRSLDPETGQPKQVSPNS